MMYEVEARALLRESSEAAALGALHDEGSLLREGTELLCAEIPFNSAGRFNTGLTDQLMRAVSTRAESGEPFATGAGAAQALVADARARAELESAVHGLVATARAPVKKRSDAAEPLA